MMAVCLRWLYCGAMIGVVFTARAEDADAPGPKAADFEMIFGTGAAAAWHIPESSPQAQYDIRFDEILDGMALINHGPEPLVIKSRMNVLSGSEVSCRVRLLSLDKRNVLVSLGISADPTNAIDRALRITAGVRHDPEVPHRLAVSVNRPDRSTSTDWNFKPYPVVSPVWDETARAPLEADMANVTVVSEQSVQFRCRIRDNRIRTWIDDRLLLDVDADTIRTMRDQIANAARVEINALTDEEAKKKQLMEFEKNTAAETCFPASGVIELSLSPGARLGELTMQPIPVDTGLYEPVALDGYARDRELLGKRGSAIRDDALPFGEGITIDGIPFRFVDRDNNGGADHVDVGRSLLRQANLDGYHQSNAHRFIGTAEVDPARIQLSVPNDRYDALYVVAASDDGRDSIPLLSASFYRPNAGFAQFFEATIPSYRDRDSEASAIPVRLENGRRAKLWLVKIPLNPSALASFADMDILEMELTKKVHQYRSYPDPYIYGWHQGGLPSGVHVYALTLHRSEVDMAPEPELFGHVWTADQDPAYTVTLENRTGQARTVGLHVATESHDADETTSQLKRVVIPAGTSVAERFTFAVKKFGIHTVRVTMKTNGGSWTETRNFCRLAPDTRAPEWTEGEGPLFGFWSYLGGHYTAPGKEIRRLMTMAGARDLSRSKPNAWPITPQWSWADKEPPDPVQYAAYKKTAVDAIRNTQGDSPELVTFFPEPHISRNLTCGNLPSYWGEEPYQYNEKEKKAIRVFFNTAKAAAEGVRAAWPETKILIPWGDTLFIVPLLRAGFPKTLIDGSGIDMIGFERLPEQQLHQMSTHRLYMLKEEYRKFGMDDPMLPYIEGTFVPTEPGACTWSEQADYYHRWSLLSLAYGITRFYSGWFAFDCGDYYGAEHYGGCGIQRRIPYNDPKPAYAHYATMTRMLERADFDTWLATGSHSTYCLKFRRMGQSIYVLWTLRGRRPVELTLAGDESAIVTDGMDNAETVASKDRVITVMTSGSPVYVTGLDDVRTVKVGEPDHSGAVAWARTRNQQTWGTGPASRPEPIAATRTIATLGDGTWRIHHERDELYENNNYDTKRYLGRMSVRTLEDAARTAPALAIHMEPQDRERKLMPWYTVIKPRRPVVIPGKSAALGLWVKAHSDWGRVIYSLRDARGERWISIGTKDQWNCDDVHSWSSFNFDGWRYLRFEMPSHAAYDAFRSFRNTWWRHAGGDGIVDLPLSIEKIIIERRTHILYVNNIQPADPADVLLGDLVAEYETEFDATRKAVTQSRIRMKLPKDQARLPNPIAEMTANNELPAPVLHGVRDPDWGYDGTRCHVDFGEIPDAAGYQVWVAAHKDGRGAVAMGKLAESGDLLQGLRPAVKLHLWLTYTDDDEKQSRPSNRLDIELVDAFGQK